MKLIKINTHIDKDIVLGGDYTFYENIVDGAYRYELKRNGYPYAIRAWRKLFLFLFLSNYIFNLLKEKEKLNIIDLGCGNCFLLKILETNFVEYPKKTINYFGIDLNENILQDFYNKNKEKINKINATLIVHNLLEGIPFENDYFDIAVCLEVIKYWKKEKIPIFLKEVYRVLKKEGIFFLSTQGIFENNSIDLNDFLKKYENLGIKSAFYIEEFLKILEEAGFSVLKIYSTEGRVPNEIINCNKEIFNIFPMEILDALFGFFDKKSHSKLFILKKQ
ncbi:MAG: class I SAM-dependent methyltransferase [Nanopusillaceae archaeon]